MSPDTSEMKPQEAAGIPAIRPVFPTRYLRFGEFQIDLHREELWKNGERVRLQGKVYQTLLILLRRPGNVVTREEVRKHLWPENPRVNFDANVNTTMNKLRQALGDSPEQPTYIETIPRRGYSFMVDVEFVESLQPALIRSGKSQTAGDAIPAQPGEARPKNSLSMTLRIATLLLAGMIVGAILVLAWFSYSRGRSHGVFNSKLPAAHAMRVDKPLT
jgi:DNA-binding winged helix-turn-helix (wHTH) protein